MFVSIPYQSAKLGFSLQSDSIYLSRSVFAKIDAAAIAEYLLSPPSMVTYGIISSLFDFLFGTVIGVK